MKKYVLILFVMFLSIASNGGVPFEIYFETNNSSQTQVEVDVKVRDFVDVSGFQLYIKWDTLVLEFDKVSYTHSDISSVLYQDYIIGVGKILSASWLDISKPKTFTDGTTIFTIKFNYSGDPCDKTSLEIAEGLPEHRVNVATYEVGDNSYEAPIRGERGEVQIPGDDCDGGTPSGTDGFCLHIGKKTAPAGSSVCVPITVDSFNYIGSLQFGVTWDTTILAWKNEGFNLAANMSEVNVQGFVDSNVIYKYILDSSNSPLNIDDGATLVELCFEVKSDAQNGDFAVVEFDNDTFPSDVTNYDDDAVEWCGTPGKVIIGEVDKTITFQASNEIADLGEKVCVNITAKQFKSIGTFQFMVNWDSDVMTYDKLGDVNNISIAPSNLSKVDDENIRISWHDGYGKTVEDDDTLFQLCYDVVGECNSSTDFKIIDSDLWEIEVAADSVPLPHEEIAGSVQVKCSIVIDSVVVKDPTCPGASDGFMKVYLQNPSNYKFNWSHDSNQSGPIANGLSEGEYILTITDQYDNAIQTDVTRQLTAPEPINVVEEIIDEICDTKGSISLQVSGLTPPYTYNWSNGSTTSTISDLEPGEYSVTIQDKNNCGSHDYSYTIKTDVQELKADGSMTQVTCSNSDDGSIEVTVEGGCEPYTITWNDGVQDQLTRENLAAGDYSVTISDKRGISSTLDFSLTSPEEITIEEVINNGTPCSIDVTVSGGNGDYTYSWSGPDGFQSEEEDISDLERGNYTLKVTDANGCSVEKEFEVSCVVGELSLEVVVNTAINNGQGVKCNGDCNGAIDAIIEANAPWKVYLDDQLIELPYNQVCGGSHTLKVVDNNNKTIEESFNMPEPDQLAIAYEATCSDRNEENGKIELNVSGGYGEYVFEWNGLPGEDSAILQNLAPGEYSVLVTDENGCQVLSNQMKVRNCYEGDCYQGSLILTPNGDGFNDFFLITCADDFKRNTLKVFDRIGYEAYSQQNYDGTWNGVDKAGKELKEDSYMWVFIGVKENGDKEVYKGTVTILRD